MNSYNAHHRAPGRLAGAALAAWLIPSVAMALPTEQKLDLLQIGTQTYTNVTVTTKARNYIFIVHAGGMTSIKTADLPLAVQLQLGYGNATPPKPSTNSPAAWVKRGFAKINLPAFKQLDQTHSQKLRWEPAAMSLLTSKALFLILGLALLLYLFHSYCCKLICDKTGHPPGLLVWLPVAQLLPLLRAAGMSGWWFVAYCVPGLSLVAHILWCFNIAKARAKSAWVGTLLLLPITNLFAFLYLAFSNGAPAEEAQQPAPTIMTLEAA